MMICRLLRTILMLAMAIRTSHSVSPDQKYDHPNSTEKPKTYDDSLNPPEPNLPEPNPPEPDLAEADLAEADLPESDLPEPTPPKPSPPEPSPPKPTPPKPTPPKPTPPKKHETNDDRPNVFTDLRMDGATLVEKILAVESTICGAMTCGSDFPSKSVRTNLLPFCQVCQCDATCVQYHTCCPDVVLQGKVEYTGLGSDCVQLQPTKIYDTFSDPLVKDLFSSMVTKCYSSNNGTAPQNLNSSNEGNARRQESLQRHKCELPLSSKPDEALPVSDTRTNLTYRNVYCARCNGVDEESLHTWKANVSCPNGFDRLLSPVPSKRQLFETLSSEAGVKTTGCHMVYVSREKDYRRKCRHPQSRVIESCSGNAHTPEIERACHMYTSLFKNKYKNMFCFLCNWFRPMSLLEFRIFVSGTSVPVGRVTFSTLIDFNSGFDDDEDDDEDEDESQSYQQLASNCSSMQFLDNTTCSCRDIHCTEWGKLDQESNTCRPTIESSAIGYQACLAVTVDLLDAPTFGIIDDLPRAFRDLKPSYKYQVTVSKWCPFDRMIYLHLQTWEKGNKTMVDRRDNSWGNAFLANGNAFCEYIYKNTDLGDKTESCSFNIVDTCPSYRAYSIPCNNRYVTPVRQTIIDGEQQRSNDDGDDNSQIKITFLPFKTIEHCAFVEIPLVEFNVSNKMLVHGVSANDIKVSKADFIKNNTVIRMCLSDYLHWSQENSSRCGDLKNDESDYFTDHWTTAGIISLITSCISLFFLILTFITYILFDQLRTGGCQNILVLTVVLFISQALYEFAIEQYENKILCSIFGVLIHYFWLVAVFSMNACTVERFAKLCFPLQTRNFFMSKKPFITATSYTFICPTIIVGCNIAANFALKNDVGYGSSSMCYINDRDSRIYSFVLPLFTIVALNVGLMVFTIVKLRRQSLPGDRKSSNTRIGLVACVRLSIVTGAIWLVSLLYEAVPLTAFGYIFTALLGLQGVVFFFSLLGNKRVLELYIKRLKLTSRENSATSGSRPTIETSENKKGGEKSKDAKYDNVVM